MRRVDRQIDDEEFVNKVLDEADTIFLALNDGEYPYCIPLNFVRVDQSLYMHCAHEGHKIDLIRKDPHVSFATVLDSEIDRAKFTTYYSSVTGRGIARIVEDAPEKCLALDAIAIKYDAYCKRPCPPQVAARVSILKVDIEEIHGKRNAPKEDS